MEEESIIIFLLIIAFAIFESISRKRLLKKYTAQTKKSFEIMFKEKEDELKSKIRNSILNEIKSDIIRLQNSMIDIMEKK